MQLAWHWLRSILNFNMLVSQLICWETLQSTEYMQMCCTSRFLSFVEPKPDLVKYSKPWLHPHRVTLLKLWSHYTDHSNFHFHYVFFNFVGFRQITGDSECFFWDIQRLSGKVHTRFNQELHYINKETLTLQYCSTSSVWLLTMLVMQIISVSQCISLSRSQLSWKYEVNLNYTTPLMTQQCMI